MEKVNLGQIYIAIDGLPCTGKTFLAKKISEKLGSRLFLDDYRKNHFLNDFYKEPEKYDLSMQLNFLLNRYNQQLEIPSGDLFQQNLVSNYLFNKDQIYASYNLPDREYILYKQILNLLHVNIAKPDLVIYLHSDNSHFLYEKISKKNRPFEKYLTEEYIDNLNRQYNYFFERYQDSPLLIINVENFDLESDETAFTTIFKEIEAGNKGKTYLNYT